MQIENPPPVRVLNVFSLAMINVIAVDSLRTLPMGAEYGFSLVFFYLMCGICFFIPTALVSAELATAWPQMGGLYVWTREAFGQRAGFLAIWLQWVYNIVWYPTVLAFVATTMAYLFNPAMAEQKTYMVVTIVLTFWFATFMNMFGMRVSSLFSITGALLGTLFPMLLIIILGGIWLYSGRPSQIPISVHAFFPHVPNLDSLVFVSGVLFGLVGIEMSAAHAGEVKNPQRDYPLALFISTTLILGSLTLASLAIAIVIPQKQMSLVSGLQDAFEAFFRAYNLSWMNPIMVISIILGAVSGVAAWIIGPTKGLLVALRDCDILPSFQRLNRHGAPSVILLIQGLIYTLLCGVFVFMPSINSSYWILSALTSQLALLVYIFMFSACIALRYSQPDRPRPYRIPFGNVGVWVVCIVGLITCVGIVIIGFLPPAQISVGNTFRYEMTLICGTIVFCLPPFFMHRLRDKSKN